MKLYIINPNIIISNDTAKYLLEHFTPYNGEVCDIVEVINLDAQDIKSGYLDRLTRGKLKHQIIYKNIDYYIKYDFDDAIYYLVQTQQIKSKNIYDIFYDNAYKCLKVYLDQGVNANIQDNLSWTPLHRACLHNRVECVKLLLLNGANVNIQDMWDNTPLHYACSNDSVESIKLLPLNGANVNIQQYNGSTPLHLACYKNNFESVKLLLNNGAKTDIINDDGLTPLQLAVKHNAKDCIKLLQDF